MTPPTSSSWCLQQSLHTVESRYAWVRLAASFALILVGASGQYVPIVAMPAIEAEFATNRSQSSIPYSMVMLGWAFGTIWMGRLLDRHGIQVPVRIGILGFGAGFLASAYAQNIWVFAATHGLMIGMLGTASLFAPLMADVSHWFNRRRGIAIAIVASGQYLAGAIWPPLVQHLLSAFGWRDTYFAVALICVVVMLPITELLRHRLVHDGTGDDEGSRDQAPRRVALSPRTTQILLCFAGLACCIAMAMPLVHLVAMCSGLGFRPARGAEMLALMLGCGVISRLSFGVLMDRIGGLRTLLIASCLQCTALFFFLPARSLASLYLASALFGLFQGGLVPCYALIVREYFPATEAGRRIGLLIMATLIGMSLGGWLSGAIYDATRSYSIAFAQGIAWNFLNIAIVLFLLWRYDIANQSHDVCT